MDWVTWRRAWLGIVFSNRVVMKLAPAGSEKLESRSMRKEKLVVQMQERYGLSRAAAFGRLECKLRNVRRLRNS